MAGFTKLTNLEVTGELKAGHVVSESAVASAAPTTATKGSVGEIRVYSGTPYICTAVSGSTYTWKALTVAS